MARDPDGEIRKQYEAIMGQELGSIFAELWQELAYLHTVWDEYRVIFGSSPEQLGVANQAAGTFFYVVQKAVWEGVLLHLARMTDPPKSTGKPNLTVTAFSVLVRPQLQAEVVRLTDVALNATEFTRPWRNRYIAHKDLPLALGDQNASALPATSRAAVESALRSLDELLNAIDYGYNDTKTAFSGIPAHSGAARLLELLRKGLSAEETEKLRFKRKWGIP